MSRNLYLEKLKRELPPFGIIRALSGLDVETRPIGASIFVDGQDTAKRTPARIDVSPGEHEFGLVLKGYAAIETNVNVLPRQYTRVRYTMTRITR